MPLMFANYVSPVKDKLRTCTCTHDIVLLVRGVPPSLEVFKLTKGIITLFSIHLSTGDLHVVSVACYILTGGFSLCILPTCDFKRPLPDNFTWHELVTVVG